MRWQGMKLDITPADLLRMPVLLAPLLLLAMTGNWWGLSPLKPVLSFLWAPLALAVFVQLVLGLPIYLRALGKLVRLRIDTDTLLVVGATAALALAGWRFQHLAYGASTEQLLLIWRDAVFGASIVAVALLGEIALRSAQRSALVPLKPTPKGKIVIAPGDFIPCDGIVRDGASEVQDPTGTDDVFPIVVKAGARVSAGARNGDGVLTVEVLEQAGGEPAHGKLQPMRDGLVSFVNWAARIMLVIALAIVVWRLWQSGAGGDMVVPILHTLALAAPLGLGLVMTAPASEVLGAARRLGVEIRDLAVLHRLRRVGAVVMGHRGVLMPDRLRVISAQCIDGVTGTDLMRRAAAVAQVGHDPWGMAVLEFAVGYRMRLRPATSYHYVLGQGMSAWVDRQEIAVGTKRFVEARGANCAPLDPAANLALSQGRRVRWVAEMTPTPRMIGFIVFGAPSANGAVETVKNLSRLGLETAWLARPDDAAHVALAKHFKIGKVISEKAEDVTKGLLNLRKKAGPLLIVTADVVPGGVASGDLVLAFGRRIMEQLPSSTLATTRHDPRIIVDLIRLAARHRQLVLTNFFIAFAAAALFAFLPQFVGSRSDLGSYEVAIVLLLATSSLSLRAMPTTANEVDEE
jgi:P-type Cu+ transporter